MTVLSTKPTTSAESSHVQGLLTRWLTGGLGAEQSGRILAHVLGCEECLDNFALAVAQHVADGVLPQPAVPRLPDLPGSRPAPGQAPGRLGLAWEELVQGAKRAKGKAREALEDASRWLRATLALWQLALTQPAGGVLGGGTLGEEMVTARHVGEDGQPTGVETMVRVERRPVITTRGEFCSAVSSTEQGLAGRRLTCTVRLVEGRAVRFETAVPSVPPGQRWRATFRGNHLPVPPEDVLLPVEFVELTLSPAPTLHDLFVGWARRDQKAYDGMHEALWNRLYGVAYHWCLKLGADHDLAQQLAADAYGYALEELDLAISGGYFLLLPNGKGRMTGRRLRPRTPVEWRGEEKFEKLVRRVWVLRCLDRLRRWRPRWILPLPCECDDGDGVEAIPAPLLSPEQWCLDQEEITLLVGALACVSAMLRKSPACREVVEATILYVKWKVSQCRRDPAEEPAEGRELQSGAPFEGDEPSRRNPVWEKEALAEVAEMPVEDLLREADLSGFDPSGAEWRQFLLQVLFEDPTDDQLRAEAITFLDGLIRREIDPPGEAQTCPQAREALRSLVRSSPASRDGTRRSVEGGVLAHLRGCEGCLLLLGACVMARRNRNALDQKIKRCQEVLMGLLDELIG
jgi:hypothetical protein